MVAAALEGVGGQLATAGYPVVRHLIQVVAAALEGIGGNGSGRAPDPANSARQSGVYPRCGSHPTGPRGCRGEGDTSELIYVRDFPKRGSIG